MSNLMNKLVDVIIPVYNVENYLGKCIESIEAQDYPAIAVTLIDDGSTDDSGSLCDALAEKYDNIHVIHQENAGVSAARNAGLDYIEKRGYGHYVTFVDPDDWVEKEHVSNMVSAMKQHGDFALCGYLLDYEGTDKQIVKNRFPSGDDVGNSADILSVCHVNTLLFMVWNKLFLYDIIVAHNVRFPHKIKQEDVDFIYEYLLYADHITYSVAPTYHYMIYRSITTANKKYKANTYTEVVFPTYERGMCLCNRLRESGYPATSVETFAKRIEHHLVVGMCGDFVVNLSRSPLSFIQRYQYVRGTLKDFYKTNIRVEIHSVSSVVDKITMFCVKARLFTGLVLLSFVYGYRTV